jgi:hypothetical protein
MELGQVQFVVIRWALGFIGIMKKEHCWGTLLGIRSARPVVGSSVLSARDAASKRAVETC